MQGYKAKYQELKNLSWALWHFTLEALGLLKSYHIPYVKFQDMCGVGCDTSTSLPNASFGHFQAGPESMKFQQISSNFTQSRILI